LGGFYGDHFRSKKFEKIISCRDISYFQVNGLLQGRQFKNRSGEK